MTTQAAAPAFPEIIRKHLETCGIVDAAIIDDTYDGISSEVLKDGLNVFIGELDDEENLVLLKSVCPTIRTAGEFGIDEARELWNSNQTWSPGVKALADPLFNVFRQRLSRLEGLAAGLEKLGLKVHRLGIAHEIPAKVPLVFLDYQLEPEIDAASAKVRAAELGEKGKRAEHQRSKAESIAELLSKRGVNRPYLVLISECADLAAVQADFRKRTNYLAGTFAFLAKDSAAKEHALFFHLRCWGVGNPALPAITNFFAAVTDSIERVSKNFQQELLALDVQDYSFIQRLSLTPDGEPLGEYFLHLFSESLSHRIRNDAEVKKARAALDQIRFKNHLISTTQPSAAVARFYREAFTDRGEEPLECHPLQHLQDPPPAVKLPRVGQGDIFVSADLSHTFIIINAGCDLQYSPINPDRLPKPETLLYLMRGSLVPFSAPAPARPSSARTEPFEINGIPYRIFWDRTVVEPVPHGKLEEWCASNGHKRIARLREAYTASLQLEWALKIGRIGLPVAPPYFSSADFQMYIRVGKNFQLVGDRVIAQVVLTQHWIEQQVVYSFTLTQEGVKALTPGFESAANQLAKTAEEEPAGAFREQKVASLLERAKEARAAASDFAFLCQLMEGEHPLAKKPGDEWKPKDIRKTVHFCWEALQNGNKLKDASKLPGEMVLLVDILEPTKAIVDGSAGSKMEVPPDQKTGATADSTSPVVVPVVETAAKADSLAS